MIVVDPTILKLFARSFVDDLYAGDGAHLRWFVGADLGFPRGPVRVFRRPALDHLLEHNADVRTEVASHDFEQSGHDFTAFTARPRLQVRQIEGSGSSAAVLPAERVVLDFAPSLAVGRALMWAEASIVLGKDGWAELDAVIGDDDLVVDHAERRWIGPAHSAHGPNVVKLVVQADAFERLNLRGHEAFMTGLRYLYQDVYDRLGKVPWQAISVHHLPVVDPQGVWYPRWAPDPLQQARLRLLQSPPLHGPPWAHPRFPPRADDAAATEASLLETYHARLAGEGHPPFGFFYVALIGMLAVSHGLRAGEPEVSQADVRIPRVVPGPGNLATDGTGTTTVSLSPFGLINAAALDVNFARLLGMYSTMPSADRWDYKIVAAFRSEDAITEVPLDERGNPIGHRVLERQFKNSYGAEFDVVSYAVNVAPKRHALPPAPTGLHVDDVGRGLDGAWRHTRVRWKRADLSPRLDPLRTHVLYAVQREGADGIQYLNEPGPGGYLPIAGSATRLDHPGDVTVEDWRVPEPGRYRYRVSGCDLFGRWSPWRELTKVLADTQAPPPPTAVRASVLDPADPTLATTDRPWAQAHATAGERFGIRVSWRWTDSLKAMAPDVAGFSLRLRQGTVGHAEDWLEQGNWSEIELGARTVNPVLVSAGGPVLESRGLAVVAHPVVHRGATAREDGYDEYTVDVAGVRLALGGHDQARVTIAVASFDRHGNPGPTTDPTPPPTVSLPAAAIRYRRTLPATPTLPEIEWATLADATGSSSYDLHWRPEPGAAYNVYLAPDRAVLAATDDTDYDPAALPAVRGAALRERGRQPDARAAFHRINSAPVTAGPVTVDGHIHLTVELPGRSTNLYVLVVVGASADGREGDWPDASQAYGVVGVPSATVPVAPAVRIASTEPAGTVRLRVDLDAATDVDLLEIRRDTDGAPTDDVWQMPIRATVVCGPEVAAERTMLWTDSGLAPFRAYRYRIRARGRADAERGVMGALGEASPAVTVIGFAPAPPPAPHQVTGQRSGGEVRLSWRLAVPLARSAPAPYAIRIERRAADTAPWELLGDVPVVEGSHPVADVTGAIASSSRAGSGVRQLVRLTAVGSSTVAFRLHTIDPIGRRSSDHALIDEL